MIVGSLASRSVAALVAVGLLWAPALEARSSQSSGQAAALQAATANAQQTLALLENRPCPGLGDTTYVSGFTDAAKLAASSSRELGTVSNALATLQRMLGDPELTEQARGELRFLGSWTVAAAAGRWSVLQVAEQALVDPVIVAGRPHPSSLLAETSAKLQNIAGNGVLTPDAASLISRLKAGVDRCRVANIAAVLAVNEKDALAAIARASSTSTLGSVSQTYLLQRGGSSVAEGQFDARYRALEQQEARASSRNKPVVAAAPAGPTQAQLAVAKRFVAASNSQSEAASLAELAEDVELRTPQGTYRGKAQVKQAVRDQIASGRTGSTGEPRISDQTIIAPGRTGSFSVTTRFYFNDAGKIRLLIVSL
jgi:hypothetical protein